MSRIKLETIKKIFFPGAKRSFEHCTRRLPFATGDAHTLCGQLPVRYWASFDIGCRGPAELEPRRTGELFVFFLIFLSLER